jgi:hypothetical protein
VGISSSIPLEEMSGMYKKSESGYGSLDASPLSFAITGSLGSVHPITMMMHSNDKINVTIFIVASMDEL